MVRPRSKFVMAVLIGLVTAGGMPSCAVRGADLGELDTSVNLVPEDAAFYTAMLRNREQMDLLLQSKAFARLKALPAVQALWKQAEAKAEQPLAQFREFLQQPENQELLELVGDMTGQEIFCFAGPSSMDFIDTAGQLFGGLQLQGLMTRIQGAARGEDAAKFQARTLLDALAKNPNLLKPPDIVLGFRLSDAKRAESQMKRLEKLWQAQAEQVPPLKGRLKREKVGSDSFLVLTLDGDMVPWDQVPLKDIEEKPGEYDDLVKKLKKAKLTVSLGVRGKYLLLAVGESPAYLTKLTRGPGRLAARPEFEPVVRFADRRLTGVSYSSKALQTKLAMTSKDLNDLARTAEEWVGQAGELTDAQKAQLKKDLDELARDLKKFIPQPGANLSFSFLTNRGQETYQYDWSQQLTLDGSKPLTLLNHVGGTPILAFVGRSKYSPEDYQLVVKWIKKAHGYAEELLVPKLDADQKAKYDAFTKTIQPLLKRLDEATAKMLLPALADGQAGLVLDARLTSKNWVLLLPPTEKPLPMLEPAIVMGVSDAGLLRKAIGEYRAIANELIAKVREIGGEQVPEFQLPAPESRKAKIGELYFYPLPGNIPVDRRLMPTAGLSDKVAALTISNEHAERLLASTPLKTNGGPLADLRRPLAMATYFHWAGLIDALAPWLDMGVQMAGPFVDPVIGGAKGDQDLATQVRTVLDVLRVFRSYASATYLEGKALVTHSETVFRDLEK